MTPSRAKGARLERIAFASSRDFHLCGRRILHIESLEPDKFFPQCLFWRRVIWSIIFMHSSS